MSDQDVNPVIFPRGVAHQFERIGQEQVLTPALACNVHVNVVPRVDDSGVELDPVLVLAVGDPIVKRRQVERWAS